MDDTPNPFAKPHAEGSAPRVPRPALAGVWGAIGVVNLAVFTLFGVLVAIGGRQHQTGFYVSAILMVIVGWLASVPCFRQRGRSLYAQPGLTAREWLFWLLVAFMTFCFSCWWLYRTISAPHA